MSDSKTAIALTLVHEGGYVDNSNDSGGATKYGITQRDVDALRDTIPGLPLDVKDLTVDQATLVYTENWWKPLYSEIESQDIANKIFDMGVLFGIGTAVRLLQTGLSLVVDGAFGPMTLAAVNEADPYSALQAYKTTLVSHAIGIANAQPKDRVFLAGWIKRINAA